MRYTPRIFHWRVGADREAIYSLCLILKVMLLICHKYNCNVTLFATACTGVLVSP